MTDTAPFRHEEWRVWDMTDGPLSHNDWCYCVNGLIRRPYDYLLSAGLHVRGHEAVDIINNCLDSIRES